MSGHEGGPIQVHAPLAGLVRALDAVPDPAFAQRLVGDGIAIEPLDETVRAPFAGTVLSIAATGHAVTLRSDDGIEILIHVGIDTVALDGAGFTRFVEAGQRVATGDALIGFDADMVAARAPSLTTPIIALNGAISGYDRVGGPIASGAPLFSVARPAAANANAAAAAAAADAPSHALRVEIDLIHGLHARPSARIADLARRFDGAITFTLDGRAADAASTTALMALGAVRGSAIDIHAVGADAEDIVGQLVALLDSLAASETDHAPARPVAKPAAALSLTQIGGVCAATGLAMGPVTQLRAEEIAVPEHARDADAERAVLDRAVAGLAGELRARIDAANAVAAEIAGAHLAILEDPALLAAARAALDDGLSAGAGWRAASRAQEAALQASGVERLRERAIDLRDVERRLLALLYGGDGAALPPAGAIVVAEDIEPSFLVDMPRGHIAGICTAGGGATSHAAILAAALGIPMLVAAGPAVLDIAEGGTIVLDAGRGWLDTAPTAETIASTRARIDANDEALAAARARAADDCRLADGTRIEVFANLASASDAVTAAGMGAEGCGLLRTEFLFAERSAAPDEEEQTAIYRAIADGLGDRPLIVRTLDIGGDKPVDYLPFPPEANPALGMRGVRFSLQDETLLRIQLRAILRGVPAAQLRIMIPMIVELDEIAAVRDMLDAERATLGIADPIPLGIMVETPAAVLLAGQLAAQADFLSIGSNDLTQYVLAMDRGNAGLAARVDACHPAVLQAIALAAQGARAHGRWLGICGGIASDPDVAPLLVGLGCDELSAVANAVPAIKQRLRGWTLAGCREVAAKALAQSSADAVRALLAGDAR